MLCTYLMPSASRSLRTRRSPESQQPLSVRLALLFSVVAPRGLTSTGPWAAAWTGHSLVSPAPGSGHDCRPVLPVVLTAHLAVFPFLFPVLCRLGTP